ncbi:MAG: tripartite AtP-independent periplasmic transporter subunit DctQ [Spirochaetes bacterium]|nr:MAG: tripartite AtP-independent periplasmic transporter subunit DctQ [Spirochaetota bacterium]
MPAMQGGRRAKALFLHTMSDRINTISEAVLFASLLLMVVVSVLQVVFRFFFTALTWSEELSCFLLVFVSLLGSAVAFKKGSHIAVTFLLDKLKGGAKKSAQTVIALLGLLFFAIVAYYGAVLMQAEAGQLTPAMGLSMKWIYLIYPVVGGITIVHITDWVFRIWEEA